MSGVDEIVEARSREWRGFAATKEPCRACGSTNEWSGQPELLGYLVRLMITGSLSRVSRAEIIIRETTDGALCEHHWVYATVICEQCYSGRHLLTSQACHACELKLTRAMHEYLPTDGAGLDDYAHDVLADDNINYWIKYRNEKGKKASTGRTYHSRTGKKRRPA